MENKARKDGEQNVSEGRSENQQGARKERFRPFKSVEEPVSFESGNVVAIIYANETHLGRLVFKVELVRLYTMYNGSGEAFSFEFSDIPHAIRCLKWAATWIWKERRRLNREMRLSWF